MNHSHHSRGHHDEHSHLHEHSHHVVNHGLSFFLSVVLNLGFVAIESFYGFMSNSTALIADAGHNLSDVLGLLLSWAAIIAAKKLPKGRYTYGLRGATIIASLANGAILLFACGAIALESVYRLMDPVAVSGATVSWIAGIGIVINSISAWVLMQGSKDDINIRGAYLHMVSDAVISFGVVFTGIAIIYTGLQWLDPLISILISGSIVYGTFGLLKESMSLSINAAPIRVDLKAIDAFLRSHPGIKDIHDLHVWALSTTENALTAHLVIPAGYPGDTFMDEITNVLRVKYLIHHSTLQIEQGTTEHHCFLHDAHSHSHNHTH